LVDDCRGLYYVILPNILGIIILHYVYSSHVSSEAGLSGEQPANMPEPMEDEEEQAQTPGRHNILGLAGPGGLTNIALVNLGNHPAIFLENSDRHHCHL